MHAGEEALFVLIPVGIVLLVDYRKRRKEKREAPAGGPTEAGSGPSETPAE
jgi:hypothetical protein